MGFETFIGGGDKNLKIGLGVVIALLVIGLGVLGYFYKTQEDDLETEKKKAEEDAKKAAEKLQDVSNAAKRKIQDATNKAADLVEKANKATIDANNALGSSAKALKAAQDKAKTATKEAQKSKEALDKKVEEEAAKVKAAEEAAAKAKQAVIDALAKCRGALNIYKHGDGEVVCPPHYNFGDQERYKNYNPWDNTKDVCWMTKPDNPNCLKDACNPTTYMLGGKPYPVTVIADPRGNGIVSTTHKGSYGRWDAPDGKGSSYMVSAVPYASSMCSA